MDHSEDKANGGPSFTHEISLNSGKLDAESGVKNMGSTVAKKISTGILLSVAYASNVGGTGSLIGSGPQLTLKGIVNEYESLFSLIELLDEEMQIACSGPLRG